MVTGVPHRERSKSLHGYWGNSLTITWIFFSFLMIGQSQCWDPKSSIFSSATISDTETAGVSGRSPPEKRDLLRQVRSRDQLDMCSISPRLVLDLCNYCRWKEETSSAYRSLMQLSQTHVRIHREYIANTCDVRMIIAVDKECCSTAARVALVSNSVSQRYTTITRDHLLGVPTRMWMRVESVCLYANQSTPVVVMPTPWASLTWLTVTLWRIPN